MDVLTDILSTLRLRGTVYFQADFCAPWGMDIKGGQVANFHLIVDGNCWLQGPDSSPPVALQKGDLVVLVHGDRHALLHAPGADAPPAESVIQSPGGRGERQIYGGSGDPTTLICGHYEYDRTGIHPLIHALPPLIHLRKDHQTEWIATASRLAVAESNSRKDGAGAVVNRLAEVLFIQLIRAYAEQANDRRGFLAGLAEPVLAKALALLHQHPERQWTLVELATTCGVSRTKLSDRFQRVLDMAPIQYLTEWRMHKARELLISENSSVSRVAEQVGYSSEWSFSKAYKRVFGEGPGATRGVRNVTTSAKKPSH